MKYWSQNQHIQMRFDIREAKPEDPEDMQKSMHSNVLSPKGCR